MKKQLLIPFAKFLSQKKSFRIAAFAALTFLTAQSSFGQITYTWTGATSSDFFTDTNWSAPVSDFTLVNNTFSIVSVVSPNVYPVLNTEYLTCGAINLVRGATFTTNANITTSINTSTIDGTANINAGTWSSPKLYIGNISGTGAVVNVTGATLTGSGVWRLGSSANSGTHYLNINNGAILDMSSTSALTIGFTSSRKGVLNVNSGGLAKIFGGLSISTTTANGTINVAGGSLEYNPVDLNIGAGIINVTAGLFKLLNTTGTTTINASSTTTNGVINIGGGTLDASGPLTLGNSTAAGLVTVNLNSGTMNITGAFTIPAPITPGTYTGLINVDAGSIVLAGDQKAAMEALAVVTNVGGIKAVAGKTISVTYNTSTDKTTVVAITTPLGVNDVKLDANAIVAYSQNKNIKIQSGNVLMADVKVYDLSGRLVASKKSIGSNEASIALDVSNGVYLVKVTTADGKVVTKKVIQ